MQKNFSLTETELASFDENGFIGPFTLVEPEVMRKRWNAIRVELQNTSRSVYGKQASGSDATNITTYDRHLDLKSLADHICSEEIVHRVRSILGPNVLCPRTEFFSKFKGDEGTDWHQGATFAGVTGGKPCIVWPENCGHPGGTINVWTAFTDSTKTNGCLLLMPRTHTQLFYDEFKQMEFDPSIVGTKVKQGIQRGFFGYDYRQLQIDPDWRPDESKAVPVELRMGQFVIFRSTLLHASLPHTGTLQDHRLGFCSRYIPTEVKMYPGMETLEEFGGSVNLERYGTVLVAGEDHYKHNRIRTETTSGHKFRKID